MPTRLFGTAVAFGILWAVWGTPPGRASEETAKEEGLECQVCHESSKPERLTDRGMYYDLLGNLDGFDEVAERFGECTYCHVARPGSGELSREGYRFRWMMEDMAGLRAWLAENHPARSRRSSGAREGTEGEPEEESEGGEPPSG